MTRITSNPEDLNKLDPKDDSILIVMDGIAIPIGSHVQNEPCRIEDLAQVRGWKKEKDPESPPRKRLGWIKLPQWWPLIALLLAIALLVASCRLAEPNEIEKNATVILYDGTKVEAKPVWFIHVPGHVGYVTIYEFTDRTRGEHCYVAASNGINLSCGKVER